MRAVEIEGAPYAARPGTREPHLVLSGDRISGFTGCNSFAAAVLELRDKPGKTRMRLEVRNPE